MSNEVDPKVQKAFADELAKETTNSTDKLTADIAELSKSTLGVEQSFFNIGQKFKGVLDTPGISSGLQTAVGGLADEWKGHHKTYKTLLWDSRGVAGQAESECNDFANVLVKWLQRDQDTIASKKAGLPKQIEKIEARAKKTASLADGFDGLKKNVAGFKLKWEKVIKEQKAKVDAADKEAVDKIAKEIVDIETKLKAKTEEIAAKTKKYGTLSTVAKVGKGISGILSFLPNLLPIPYIGIITKVFNSVLEVFGKFAIPDMGPLEKEQKALQEEFNKKKLEKERYVNKDRAALDALNAGLTSSEADFNNIADRLGLFSGVWSSITNELKQVQGVLEEASDANIKESAFYEKLTSAKSMYLALGKCFNKYQTTVIAEDPSK